MVAGSPQPYEWLTYKQARRRRRTACTALPSRACAAGPSAQQGVLRHPDGSATCSASRALLSSGLLGRCRQTCAAERRPQGRVSAGGRAGGGCRERPGGGLGPGQAGRARRRVRRQLPRVDGRHAGARGALCMASQQRPAAAARYVCSRAGAARTAAPGAHHSAEARCNHLKRPARRAAAASVRDAHAWP